MMETSDIAAGKQTVPQHEVLDVGLTFREARERLGISVHDVAERIKFSPKQVEALEANDFTHLQQGAFLRGFVRSYARMLQLDEAALVAALPGERAKQTAAGAQGAVPGASTLGSLRRVDVRWLVGALGVAVVLGLYVLLHDIEPAAKPTKVAVETVPLPAAGAGSAVAESGAQALPAEAPTTAEPQEAPEPASAGSSVAAVVSEAGQARPQSNAQSQHQAEATVQPQPQAQANAQSRPQPQANAQSQPQPQANAEEAGSAVATPPVPLEKLKLRPLHFVFSEDTWAEVIDANGAVLLSRVNPGGSEKWVGGPHRAPYDVSIAHPANVKLYYKGREIDLSPYAGMAVARFKVE